MTSMVSLSLRLNGSAVSVPVPAETLLIDFLRETQDLKERSVPATWRSAAPARFSWTAGR